jgi:hypothetical protein
MAYTINLTDGTIFATIADGTINTSSSMILVGKNYAGYGEFLDENFIHLLENGSNSVPPGAPLTGQLWWDKANSLMKVYTGTTFKTISAATASATAPTNNVTGDIWWDTTNQQMKVWNGTSFTLVGPASSAGQGTSGAIVDTVTDNVAVDHVVIKMFVNDVIVAIISKDATFTPQVALSGFATIGPGMQLSTTVSNNLFRGTASNSSLLDGVARTAFLRSDTNSTTTGTLGVLNDTGLTVGADQDAKISVSTVTSAVNIQNQTQDANIAIQVNDGGSTTTALLVNGATSQVGVLGITNLNASGVGNIGAAGAAFNTVFATATTALYADVAERFAADEEYMPGTVVEIGGEAEITKAVNELSENVFGVISTRAAYLMNSGAGTDSTHPPIAMTGRVPVRVSGIIRKGDRLVAAGNGLARSARANEATAFNVIGRALENKTTDDEGVIEAIVTINN